MRRDDLGLLVFLGALGAWIYLNRTKVGGAVESAAESAQAVVMGWATVNEGPVWVPVINQTESAYGIPANLLARQAYQESRFRADVIDGTTASPAGALGILQLMPQYFSTVQVPTPFTAADTTSQITQAAQQMVALYNQFRDWGLALAGYNDGAGNVNAYLAGNRALPAETQQYVSEILADVPLPSALTV